MSLVVLAVLCEYLGVSESTGDRLRRDGMPCYDVSPSAKNRRQRVYRYDLGEVLAWLRTRQEGQS